MIFHDAGHQRFTQDFDGREVFASYRLRDGVYALVHVEAEPELRGTGAADRFMAALIAHGREQGLKFAPYCSYARAWFKRHPDAGDVLSQV